MRSGSDQNEENCKAGHSIKRLSLSSFRNYGRASLSVDHQVIVLTGANGAGKTNILEAVSLLSPGRGLRGAGLGDFQNKHLSPTASPWAVHAQLDDVTAGLVSLGTGLLHQTGKADKRVVNLEGDIQKSQSTLAEYTAILWLTPQMDRLFIDSSSSRRRFLDRLVFTFDPAHAGRTTRYENGLRQRSKLLKDGVRDDAWLAALESGLAETGVAVAAARVNMVRRLQQVIQQSAFEEKWFPKAIFGLKGFLEEALVKGQSALQVEEQFLAQLKSSRALDAETGGAQAGPHKTDLLVTYAQKQMPAEQCSTGEQKALLTALILSHAELVRSDRGIAPILLMDEIAAHYDEKRRHALFDRLETMKNQVWLTGTDENLFDFFAGRADSFHVDNASLLKR